MSRLLCPKCEEHPLLDDALCCILCNGKYVWHDSIRISSKKGREALNRLRSRS